ASFADALDDLWVDPERWRRLGQQGRAYVAKHFRDPEAFDCAWRTVLAGLDEPLTEQLRKNGLRRAAAFSTAAWRERFDELVNRVLEQAPQADEQVLDLRPRMPEITVDNDARETAAALRIALRGARPILADG